MLNKNFLETKNQLEKIFCHSHPTARHWRPLGQPSSPWQCEICSPPPNARMVGSWSGDPHLADTRASGHAHQGAGSSSATTRSHADGQPTYQPSPPITVNYEQPACPTCHCSWIVEVDLPTLLALRCWACKRDLTPDDLARELSKPKPLRIINQHRQRAVYERESDSVKIVPC
jgi:hypothetical protein